MKSVSDCVGCAVDHFNHVTAAEACLTCGGEADQPKTGQPSCECKGGGKDFQVCDLLYGLPNEVVCV
jgi:hypothetical protein